MKDHKHYRAAYNAHCGTSFSPDKRAEMYCASFDSEIETLKAAGVGEAQIAKYEQLWLKHMAAKARCMSTMITGGSNFNVRRNDKMNGQERNASDASVEYYNKILEYAKKEKYYAENPDARPIMAGDSDAVERLQKKLANSKQAHDKMLAVNKVLRKKPVDKAALVEILGSNRLAEQISEKDCMGNVGFAPYALNGSRAGIKAIEERLRLLEKQKAEPTKESTVNGVRIVENPDDVRLELYFDGKPSDEMRSVLKSNAFKWTPSKGAWQRQLTNNARYSFKNFVLPSIEQMEA